jgi:FkbM family methyltransferase
MGLLKLSKYIIKKILLKLGYKIINKYNHYFGIDESIEKIFNKAKFDKNKLTIFDIGANIGQSIKRFRRKFNKSKIYSFEPNPEIFKDLVEIQKKDSNLKVFNFAFSNKDSITKLFSYKESGQNSLYPIKNKNKKNFFKVNTRKISTFMKKNKIKKIDLLKIDTQGSELDIIKGCGNYLKKILIIEIELIFNDIYNKNTISEIEKILSKFGFITWDIPNIVKFPRSDIDRIYFADILFVNTKLINCN